MEKPDPECYPIFVIALPGSERLPALEERLRGLGLDYLVFPAVDGREGLTDQCAGMIDREAARENLGREMSDVEFACAL